MPPETVGLWHDRWHNYRARYDDLGDIGPLPGVTGTIGILDKPAVAYWRGTTVASIIADNLDLFRDMIATGGKDEAVKWAGKLPGYEADKAADTGTLVHMLVEKIVRQHDVTIEGELIPYATAFRRASEELGLEVISVERAVCNLNDGYAGTFDIYGYLRKHPLFGDKKVMVDVKTWRKRPLSGRDRAMYSETALQLAAYGNAEFTGIKGDPKRYAAPRPEAYAVLHLRPDQYAAGYQVYPFDVGEEEYEVFRALLKPYRWKRDRASLVIGDPATGLSSIAA